MEQTGQPYSSADYLQSFREGQESGFDYYFKKWFRSLCFYTGRTISNEREAEDLVTDAFIKVWQKRTIFNNEAHLRNYLSTIVRNGCLKKMRSQKIAAKYEKEQRCTAEKEEACFFKNMLLAEFLCQLYQSFEHLPPVCRRVLIMRYIEGKKIREVAEEMKITESTIATHRQYGLKILRRQDGVVPKRSFGAL